MIQVGHSLPEVMATALDAKIGEPALELTRYYLDVTRRTIIISKNTHGRSISAYN
jgi:hypothetical protein